jgi:transcription elongation factor GreA
MSAATSADAVQYGSTVTYTEPGTHDQRTVRIVGRHEADPTQGLLSEDSPVGHALLGRRSGEVVQFMVPRGTRHLHIDSVN